VVGTAAILGANTFTAAQNFARATVASHATTADIWGAAGNQIDWTGIATTTAFPSAPQAGIERVLICDGAASFTAGANMLIDGVASAETVTCAANDKIHVYARSTTVFELTRTKYDGTAQVVVGGQSVVRSARASNTILAEADRGTLIDLTSGTFSQTFTAAATLGSGWFCYIRNSGTGDITLEPDGAEQIDGLTNYVMYGGECRLVQCTGTAFYSVVLTSFYRAFTTTGTFTKPPGYSAFDIEALGGGGGGGSGAKQGTGNQTGGGGGGGGARDRIILLASAVGATETVTIGAGGTAGAAQATNTTAGNSGADGGFTTFGTLTKTYGGSGGYRGGLDGSASYGGAGGGAFSASGGAALASGTAGNSSHFDGASGAGAPNNSGANAGAGSIFGGCGGGAGGSAAADTDTNGGAGGSPAAASGGGGTGGVAATSTNPGAGVSNRYGGGGGWRRNTATAGAADGAAGGPGGGGGGGGAGKNSAFSSGAGGAGGNGYVTLRGIA